MEEGKENTREKERKEKNNEFYVGVLLGSDSRLFYPRLNRSVSPILLPFSSPFFPPWVSSRLVVRNVFSRASRTILRDPRWPCSKFDPHTKWCEYYDGHAFRCQPRTMDEVLIARKQRRFFFINLRRTYVLCSMLPERGHWSSSQDVQGFLTCPSSRQASSIDQKIKIENFN